jgi:CO/xanthine dehydrogenase FAD-binding subunit
MRVISGVDALANGKPLDEALAGALGRAAWQQCHPLINVAYDDEYRHEMVPVFVRRAVLEAAMEPPA